MDFAADVVDREIIEMLRDKPDLNRLKLKREGETHIFRYDRSSSDAVLQTFGKMAADRDYSMTWYDAAVLSQRLRRLEKEQLGTFSELCKLLRGG